MAERVIVVGAGMGGLAAAVRAAELGADVVLLEKGPCVGGAASFSGGQVWVGANHVEQRRGIDDSVADTLAYVHAIAAKRDAASIDPALAERWVTTAPVAAKHFEDSGVIRWEIIDGYPDYYPEAAGGRTTGRYLTGALFDGATLGAWRDKLLISPYFLIGVRYAELFAWGGVSSRQHWDWELIERRRAEDKISFGPGVTAPFFRAAIEHGVDIRLDAPVTGLVERDGKVAGVRIAHEGREEVLEGIVILATGGHDWSRDLAERFLDLSWEDGGSIAPPTLTGDAIAMGEKAGAEVRTIPPWAAPVLPGYRIDAAIYPGDQGFRNCLESGLPHAFIVNARGERFCDDSFHSDIVHAALGRDADGRQPNLPMFLVWDAQHHQKYGLGLTRPGGDYPPGLVTSAPTLQQLGETLGIDPEGLARTAEVFSGHAREGRDPAFARGSNPSVQVFRGDRNHGPNGNVGTVEQPPFHGMRLRLLNTGIAAGGLAVDRDARVLRPDGSVVAGLYAVGECAARDTGGVGYNSGYSLSRAMTFGYIAANHATGTGA